MLELGLVAVMRIHTVLLVVDQVEVLATETQETDPALEIVHPSFHQETTAFTLVKDSCKVLELCGATVPVARNSPGGTRRRRRRKLETIPTTLDCRPGFQILSRAERRSRRSHQWWRRRWFRVHFQSSNKLRT